MGSYSNPSTEELTGCHGHHPLDGRTIYLFISLVLFVCWGAGEKSHK